MKDTLPKQYDSGSRPSCIHTLGISVAGTIHGFLEAAVAREV